MAKQRAIIGKHKDPVDRKKYLAQAPDIINVPEPPADLLQYTPEPPPGKCEVWHKFYLHAIESIRAMGVDSWTDLPGIIEFCDIHTEVQRLKNLLKGPDGVERYTSIGSTGQDVVSPEYQALIKIRPQYHKMLNDFGMTPRGRAYMYDKRKTEKGKVSTLMDMLNDSE